MVIVPVVKILGPTAHMKGYFTVLAENGNEAVVPDFLKSRVELRMKQNLASPLLKDTSYGNCGSSFINITTKSNGDMVQRIT